MNLAPVIINFKTYEQTIGKKAIEVARKIDSLEDSRIALAVQAADISAVENAVKNISVFAQHIDGVGFGQFTGHVHVDSAKEAGAAGTLLNHSENQIPIEEIKKSVEAAKKAGLQICICADTPEKSKEVAQLNPDTVAIEPPELIGSGISVSNAKPEIVTDTIKLVKEVSDVPVYCGAGVSTKEDVEKSMELGAKGVLLASAVTKAEHPEKVTKELLSGLD